MQQANQHTKLWFAFLRRLKYEKEIEKEGLALTPGLKWPYEIWCTKHEEETCKYGVCPEWEED